MSRFELSAPKDFCILAGIFIKDNFEIYSRTTCCTTEYLLLSVIEIQVPRRRTGIAQLYRAGLRAG